MEMRHSDITQCIIDYAMRVHSARHHKMLAVKGRGAANRQLQALK